MAKATDTLEIVRPDAIALLEELGVKTAEKYSNEKLAGAITKIAKKRDEDDDDLDSEECQALLEEVMGAIEDETEIEVTGGDDDEEEDDEDEKPAKKGKSKSKSKKKSKDEDEEEEEEEEDEDEAGKKKSKRSGGGAREEMILRALSKSKKGLDISQLAEVIGVPDTPNSRPYKTMRELMGTKKVVKTDDGNYKLK